VLRWYAVVCDLLRANLPIGHGVDDAGMGKENTEEARAKANAPFATAGHTAGVLLGRPNGRSDPLENLRVHFAVQLGGHRVMRRYAAEAHDDGGHDG